MISPSEKVVGRAAIPSTDGLHDGTCTVPNATAVCASGLCNATTKTCGGANGATCAGAGDCENNVCGTNKVISIKLNQCKASKTTMPFKNVDYMMFDLEFQAFADCSGAWGTIAMTDA